MIVRATFALGAVVLISAQPVRAHAVVPTEASQLPAFEENHGQFSPSTDYLLRGDRFEFQVSHQPVIGLITRRSTGTQPDTRREGSDRRAAPEPTKLEVTRISMRFPGSDPSAQPEGQAPIEARTHYLTGEDRNDWRTDVQSYQNVRYRDFYPGIDIEYRVTDALPEYVFFASPGSDVESIAIEFDGVRRVSVDEDGALVLDLGERQLRQRPPMAWQVIGGERHEVKVVYRVTDNRVEFDFGSFDAGHELVIDPVLELSSYFGGAGDEILAGVHADGEGNIYLIGTTTTPGLATSGAFQESNPGLRREIFSHAQCPECTDPIDDQSHVERVSLLIDSGAVFVSKFSPDGQTRLWTTYLRSSDAVPPPNIGTNSTAVSANGEVALGLTGAGSGYPLRNQAQLFSAAHGHAYVAKLTSDGGDLVFGSYLQFSAAESSVLAIQRGLDMGPNGEVAVVGGVGIGNAMPEVNPLSGQSCTLNADLGESTDGFVTLFDANGVVEFSTCIGGEIQGGAQIEWMRGVRVGVDGRIYVVGYSSMTDFPLVVPMQNALSYRGSRDMTISIIDPGRDGSSSELQFSTYFGPSEQGAAATKPSGSVTTTSQEYFPIDIDVDSSGHVVVTGTTNEFHFPIVNAWQPNLAMPLQSYGIDSFPNDAQDIFLASLDPATGSVVFSTYFGGSSAEDGLHVMTLDNADNIYLATVTRSADYPVTSAVQNEISGEANLGLSKFSPQGRLVWSTFFGGTNDDMLQSPGGIAISSVDGKVIAGARTESIDFPVLTPIQAKNGGGKDAAFLIIDQSTDTDSDGDGVIDSSDAFPADPAQWRDTNANGIGDNTDPDMDGDGVPNASDQFPLLARWSVDTDRDGIGDADDLFPTNPLLAYDFDGDGAADFADDDADGDGVPNRDDLSPLDPAFARDFDFDGVPDSIDPDIDGDGVADEQDPDPFNADVPVITFNLFNPRDVSENKSPLPPGFDTPDGAIAWTADFGPAFDVPRSLGSRVLADGETAVLQLVDTFESGTLMFNYRVDSERGGDFFRFVIDGVEQFSASGDTGWVESRLPIQAGERSLEWRYEKNQSVSSGFDAAWIDDIVVRRIGDVAVAVANGLTTVRLGGHVTYDIPVVNFSLNEATSIGLSVPVPPQYRNAEWVCVSPSNEAGCPATNGTGAISEQFSLVADSGILFRMTFDIQEGPEEPVVVRAELAINSDFIDEVTENNQAEDVDFIGIFGTDFE